MNYVIKIQKSNEYLGSANSKTIKTESDLTDSQKPINIKSMMSDLKYGECPKCGEGVNDEMCYCSTCGSRLDWSEEE